MVHIAAWQQIYYNGDFVACQAFYRPMRVKFPPPRPQRGITFRHPRIAFCRALRYNIPSIIFREDLFMLFWIGLGVLLIGGIIARIASKQGDKGEALKKVGIALIFIGTAILLFVLTINILVWTGRFGVAS